jgi:hypothetical protein
MNNNITKSFIAELKDTNDGTGDGYVEIPDEVWDELGWEVGMKIDLTVDPAGNVIIVRPVA